MASRHRGKKGDNPQYTTLYYGFLKSPAWRSLSGTAVKVWLELHTRYNGGNNGNVRLSLNEAASTLGMSKGTAQRAFLELEGKGFIALHTPGNWYHRRAHEYRLTTKPMQTQSGKQKPTEDWKTWPKNRMRPT